MIDYRQIDVKPTIKIAPNYTDKLYLDNYSENYNSKGFARVLLFVVRH